MPISVERRFTRAGESPYASVAVPAGEQRDPQPGRLGRLPARRVEVPAAWSQVACDILAQKYFRKAGVPARLKRGARGGRARLALPPRRRRGALARPAGGRALGRRDQRASRCSTASPAAGPTGAGRAATSTPRRTRAPSTTRCATCWRARWRRPTRRSGSTPACTGPTASTARRRATTTSTPTPASSTRSTSAYERPQPHACFIQSRRATTSSTRAASWTSGSARRASSSTARGTGTNFSHAARRGRAALRRRQVVAA